MSGYGWLGFAFAAFLSLWQWDHNRLEAGHREQAARIDQAEIDRLAGIVRQQSADLQERASAQALFSAISTTTRQLTADLNAQSLRLRQDLAELKRTDEQVSAYLSGVVPVAIGLRYARPSTTDPAAWRAGAHQNVRTDAVPAAGPPSLGP